MCGAWNELEEADQRQTCGTGALRRGTCSRAAVLAMGESAQKCVHQFSYVSALEPALFPKSCLPLRTRRCTRVLKGTLAVRAAVSAMTPAAQRCSSVPPSLQHLQLDRTLLLHQP